MIDSTENKIADYASVIIKLLRGVLYDESDNSKIWNDLLRFQKPVREYFAKIGIELHLDESEGYAFLKQKYEEDKNELPRLVNRKPVSYEVSLLCVILREVLDEFDINNTDSRHCFITNQEIKEKIEMFFKDKSDKVKLLKNFDTYINKAVELGYLKITKESSSIDKGEVLYEVRRILKAKISCEKLEEIKERMRSYATDAENVE